MSLYTQLVSSFSTFFERGPTLSFNLSIKSARLSGVDVDVNAADFESNFFGRRIEIRFTFCPISRKFGLHINNIATFMFGRSALYSGIKIKTKIYQRTGLKFQKNKQVTDLFPRSTVTF